MGYVFSKEEFSLVFQKLKENYLIFAPKVFSGSGCYSDTDVVRYGEINDFPEIEYDRRSDYSFKESIFSINETLFTSRKTKPLFRNVQKRIFSFLSASAICTR